MKNFTKKSNLCFAVSILLVLAISIGTVQYISLELKDKRENSENVIVDSENNNANEASIDIVAQKLLIPGGNSIGVRMDVKGVLIVGLEEIETADGHFVNPGLEAGLEIGDLILDINGTKVYNAHEVQKVINQIKGDLTLKIKRKDELMNVKLNSVISIDDGLYKLGVWVKDKTAGIGTLTYYDAENQTFGALGHGITDAETGHILSVGKGELLNAKVQSVKEGKIGRPGEIKGIFYQEDLPLGKLRNNTEYGIFGDAYPSIEEIAKIKPMPICKKEDVKCGDAYIYTTINGNNIEKYDIEIIQVNKQDKPDTKGMIIKVTDPELIKKTGGIVQGMSGSPIIQEEKIVGAITHVFVKNPEMGYGVFIEWMINE